MRFAFGVAGALCGAVAGALVGAIADALSGGVVIGQPAAQNLATVGAIGGFVLGALWFDGWRRR